MRAFIESIIPHIPHQSSVLSLEAFTNVIQMLDNIADKEISEQYENTNLVSKKFVKFEDRIKVKYLYNVSRRIIRNHTVQTYDSYNSYNSYNYNSYNSQVYRLTTDLTLTYNDDYLCVNPG